MRLFRHIITILAACLIGLCQGFAQERNSVSADELFKEFPQRLWSTQARLTIGAKDWEHFGYFPEYKVRIDYILCKAMTHEVTSVETRTVSFKANDFSEQTVLLSAPAGYQIRDDIHFDIQTKVNGTFKTIKAGYRAVFKDNEGRLSKDLTVYYNKEKELIVQEAEIMERSFGVDNMPGEEYRKLYDPKLAKSVFYTDKDGYVWINTLYDRKEMVKKFMGHFPDTDNLQAPSMKDGFWPTKIEGVQLRHTMTFALKYNNEKTPVPDDMKLYLFIESAIYNRNGQLVRIANYDSGESIKLELSSTSKKPRIQGTFPMDNNERLFPYPVWVVVVKNLRTGKYTAVDWGLLDMHAMFSENIYAFNVEGTILEGNLKVTRKE